MPQKVRGPRELSETLPTSVMPLAKIVEDSIEESISFHQCISCKLKMNICC